MQKPSALRLVRSLLLGLPFLLAAAPDAHAHNGFRYEGRCATAAGKHKIVNSERMKAALRRISRAANGVELRLYSCFRDQAHQDSILRSRGCRPFGSRDCRQSVAKVSYHTRGIAADIKSFASSHAKQCQLLAQGREGGLGGVGTYPRGDGHFDVGPARAWNRCRGVVGGRASYSSRHTARARQRFGLVSQLFPSASPTVLRDPTGSGH